MINLDRLESRVEKATVRNKEDRDALTWLQYELNELIAKTLNLSMYEINQCKFLLEKIEKALERSR